MVSFIDDVAWRQRKDTIWGVNSFGCDTARVLYRGARIKRDAFLRTLHKWGPMPGNSFMFMENYTEGEGTVSFPGIEVIYTGFKDGGPPQVKYTDGTSLQSISASGTTTDGTKVNGTFLYKASRTSWTWYETAPPNPSVPRYATVRGPVDPFTNIINAQIQDEESKTRMVPYADFVALFNTLITIHFVSTYERELLIPNRLWCCRADVDYKFNG